jgi:hypothetical protein
MQQSKQVIGRVFGVGVSTEGNECPDRARRGLHA